MIIKKEPLFIWLMISVFLFQELDLTGKLVPVAL